MSSKQLLDALAALDDSSETIKQFRRLVVGLAVSGKLEPSGNVFAESTTDGDLTRNGSVVARGESVCGTRSDKLAVLLENELPKSLPRAERFVQLRAVARIEKGRTGIAKAAPGSYPLVVTAEGRLSCDHYDFDGAAAIVPLVSSAGHGKASIQRLHYQEGKFALGSILAAIFPLDPAQLSARFLFEYLSAFKDDLLVSRMIGTANVSLSVSKIADVPVPLPPPPVQKRVDDLMALCDRLEAERVEREAARDRLTASSLARLAAPDPDTFRDGARFVLNSMAALTARVDQIQKIRQTILNLAVRGRLVPQDPGEESASALLTRIAVARTELRNTSKDARIGVSSRPDRAALPIDLPPGWLTESFDNLFLFIDYRGQTPPKTDRGIPLITAKNVRMGTLNREPREFISANTFEKWMTRGFPRLGDLLFTTEAPLANVCVNNITEPFALAQRIICLQPYGPIETTFMRLAIMSRPIQAMIDGQATGLTAKGIKSAKLKPLPLPVPPLGEQRRIVAKVDELMTLCDRLEASLQVADETRSSLLGALLADALRPERH